jgi:SNF2 family DNA or RNA helicase
MNTTFKMKTKPFAHQQECFDRMKHEPYYGLFAEPGLGKTKIVLDILSFNYRDDFKALVVCPNTIVENWADEIEKHSDLSYVLITGTAGVRKALMRKKADVYVINYEATRNLWKDLKSVGYDYLILDESTAVKNPKSQQAKACVEISQNCTRRIIMTGTPVMNSPLDLFSQYKVLDPTIFGVNYYRFRNRYAVMGGYMNKQAIGWRNMHDFKMRVFTCAVRKTKEECLDLPNKLYQVVKVDMTPEQTSLYKKLKEEFIFEYKDVTVMAPTILTRLMRFSQITAGFTKDTEGIEHAFKNNPKIDWVIDFISNLDRNRKVVLFCRFRREIAMVEEALRRIGRGYVSVHGGSTERIDLIKQFNNDTDTQCFIGQSQTAGIGINLTSGHYCIFMSNSYSYGDRVQCEDRLHRIGQDSNVTYIDLLARNTIDLAIHRALRQKENLANMIVGDISNIL